MIDWVEFYVDDELVHIDEIKPFSWTWDESNLIRREIKVKAHDPTRKYTIENIFVWKFF